MRRISASTALTSSAPRRWLASLGRPTGVRLSAVQPPQPGVARGAAATLSPAMAEMMRDPAIAAQLADLVSRRFDSEFSMGDVAPELQPLLLKLFADAERNDATAETASMFNEPEWNDPETTTPPLSAEETKRLYTVPTWDNPAAAPPFPGVEGATTTSGGEYLVTGLSALIKGSAIAFAGLAVLCAGVAWALGVPLSSPSSVWTHLATRDAREDARYAALGDAVAPLAMDLTTPSALEAQVDAFVAMLQGLADDADADANADADAPAARAKASRA